MEDFLNDVDASSEQVVDAQDTEATTSEVTEVVAENETTEKVEPVAKVQSAEDNAKFAAARRAAEAEKNALKAQNDRLMQALGQYGYQGSPEDIADALFAQSQGISVEEATAQRQAAEAENAKYQQLESQLETYRPLAIKALMAEDLAKVQTVNPEVKNLDDLGGDFFALMGALHDPILAYDALQAKKARETKPIPQDIGAVNSSSSKEKDFYTSAEIDKLTSADYDRDPKLLDKVMKSIHRLGPR
jgi:chemotaxis protein histidine kinase CheA